MKDFAFVESTACFLIPCLLLLTVGCDSSAQSVTRANDIDRSRSIVVLTTDSLYYRFSALEWSADANGDISGSAQEYRSREAADQGDSRAGSNVTIPAQRIASIYEPGGTMSGAMVGVEILFLISALFVGWLLMMWLS